jgi:hypothetical protein
MITILFCVVEYQGDRSKRGKGEKMYIGGIGLKFPSEVPGGLIAQSHNLVQTPLLDHCHVG